MLIGGRGAPLHPALGAPASPATTRGGSYAPTLPFSFPPWAITSHRASHFLGLVLLCPPAPGLGPSWLLPPAQRVWLLRLGFLFQRWNFF